MNSGVRGYHTEMCNGSEAGSYLKRTDPCITQLKAQGPRVRAERASNVSELPQLPVEGRCKAPWKREFKLPWREAGPPNHHDDNVDSGQ